MAKNLIIAVALLFFGNAAVSQSTSFEFKQVEPATDCKPVMQFDVTSPVAASTYDWDFGDGNTASGSTVTHAYATDGSFTVTLTTNGDAANAKVQQVNVLPFNYFIALRDSAILGKYTYAYKIGSPFFKDNAAGFTFNWAITDGNGNVVDPASTEFGFEYTFTTAGTYNVGFTITSPNGCSGNLARQVVVVDSLSVPNVFTPDGDGVNDVWAITSNGKDNISVKIYSRFGTLVYEDNSPVILWDGKTAFGEKLPSGVYYYVLKRDDNAFPVQKGFFYLLRGK